MGQLASMGGAIDRVRDGADLRSSGVLASKRMGSDVLLVVLTHWARLRRLGRPDLRIAGLLTSACMIGVKFAALEGFEEKMGAEARLEAERAALVPLDTACCVASQRLMLLPPCNMAHRGYIII